METYFWCKSGEDCTIIIPMVKAQLLKQLALYTRNDEKPPTFLIKVPESDKGCWMDVPEDAVLIIKGEIVTPTKKEVVTKYEIK